MSVPPDGYCQGLAKRSVREEGENQDSGVSVEELSDNDFSRPQGLHVTLPSGLRLLSKHFGLQALTPIMPDTRHDCNAHAAGNDGKSSQVVSVTLRYL
jgi:hypothetical protein